MRLLIVGDYHAEPSDLDDCQNLANLIIEKAVEHQATVLFTGDQYHTHAIIHAEVQLFWLSLYQRLKDAGIESISLVGNHDRPGSSHSKASSMLAHVHHTHVIREPFLMYGVMLFVPYMDDGQAFVDVCNKHPKVHTLICHQTFNGSKYENGIYAKDGVDPNLIPQVQVISGHIHSPQEFDKVWYVGAPRWRTLADANTDRAIWLVDFNMDGSINSRTPFDTGKVCRQIFKLEDHEGGTPLPQHLDRRHEWRIDVHGTAAYIEQRVPELKAAGAKVRTFKTELDQPKVKESEGIDVAFGKWVEQFQPQYGTDKDVLKGLLNDRVKHV